jgi:CHAT domain-containing protein
MIGDMPAAPSPDLDHAAGLWFLIYHESPHAIDRAISHLKAALHSRPKSARLLSDLAAAYFVRADAEHRPTDLVLALDLLERALALSPNLAESHFNRGLVLERFGFCAPAEEAWRDYLAMDSKSSWAREAWSRRAGMPCEWSDWSPVEAWAAGSEETPPEALSRFFMISPVEILRRGLNELFPAWAEAYLVGDGLTAAQRLSRLRQVGEELRVRTGDETISKSVRKIEESAPPICRRLALAHKSFGEGARLHAASLYARAQESYRRVEQSGSNSTSPIGLWARYGVFSTLVTEGNFREARKVASKLRTTDLTAFPVLAARLSWSEGLIQLRTGAFADSRQSFDASARIYEKLGDPVQRGAARALAAESLHALGLQEEAWRARLEAFRALGQRPSGPLHNLLIDAALASREEGHGHAALLFQTAGLDGARTLQSLSRTVEALLWRSKVLASLDRKDQALADLDVALDQARSISDPGVRSRLTADVQEAQGSLVMTHDPVLAVAALNEAIAFYWKTEYAWKLPSALLLRARAWLLQGETALAEKDLETALREFERRDRAMPPEIFRYSHFERAQETFEEMMRLQLARHRPELALSYLERARRAAWPTTPQIASAEPNSVSEAVLHKMMARLPEGVVVVEFAVLDGHLLTWVLHKGRMRFLDLPLGGLAEEVDAFWNSLSTHSEPADNLQKRAEGLYAKLVAPWIAEVPPGTRLVFIPDRFLHRLAFAALRDPRRQKWLAEDFVVSTSPSLGFAVGTYRPAGLQVGESATLLIGDPRFDPSETGDLGNLPGAAEEIRKLAPLYPGATALIGAEARKDRILAALAEADIVHYAGHALANPRNPWVSFLALARPAKGGTGLLLARDIHALPHRKRRVVVLSACGSASDGQLRSAGFAPLVSSFLAIGADSVVSSLWSVRDRDVQPLALEFHRGLQRGLSVADALHRARLELIERSPAAPPHLWANLQVTGLAESQTIP